MAMYAERLKKLLFVTNQDELLALEAEEDEERHTHIIEHDHGAGWSSLWKFIGPGYLVAVGYMDPVSKKFPHISSHILYIIG